MSTSQARNGGCLWAGQYFVPTEEIERQYPWGAPETGAENPATNQSTQTKGAIDYLLFKRIIIDYLLFKCIIKVAVMKSSNSSNVRKFLV